MIRKILISVLFSVATVVAVAQEPDYRLINDLKYNRVMHGAMPPAILMKIPFGSSASSVGGFEQDTELSGEGVPFAFRPSRDAQNTRAVWVLDSVNRALKLFSEEGKLKESIDLKKIGKVVRDFTFDGDNGFWLLAPVEGYIHRIDRSGKIIGSIEGFCDARALECANNNEILVDMPTMSSVLRFGPDELLKKEYPYENGISLTGGVGGNLLGLEIEEKNVKLVLRQQTVPPRNLTLAQFPLDIEKRDVTYAGAEIVGKDSSGNIYLSLVACDMQGVIYRDRLYRCTVVGKVLAYQDVLSVPYLAPDLPRRRVVAPDGRVITFFVEGENYVLAEYKF